MGEPLNDDGAIVLVDEGATEAAAARMAVVLRNEAGPVCVTLSGALGSGKTTFARGLLRALGVRGTVRSPSFTLVEEYVVADWEALHLDLYRLGEGADLTSLGVRERFVAGTLLLVEWPERAARGALPQSDVAIELSARETSHRLAAVAGTPAGTRLIAALLQNLPDDSRLSPENA